MIWGLSAPDVDEHLPSSIANVKHWTRATLIWSQVQQQPVHECPSKGASVPLLGFEVFENWVVASTSDSWWSSCRK